MPRGACQERWDESADSRAPIRDRRAGGFLAGEVEPSASSRGGAEPKGPSRERRAESAEPRGPSQEAEVAEPR